MGNEVRLRVNSNRLDRTQSYTATIGETEITVQRRKAPLTTATWGGPVLIQRPITKVTGTIEKNPVDLYTESSGLTTGEAFGKNYTCAVNGWSVFNTQPCF